MAISCPPEYWPATITSVAALVGVGVAVAGLNTWRDQLRGRTEYELARRVLRAVLEVRDRIGSVRSPFISSGELAAGFKEAGLEPEGDPERDDRSTYLVYDRRWKWLTKALSDLRVELLEAEVLWGSGVKEPEAALHRCVGELNAAVQYYMNSRRSPDEKIPDDMRRRFFSALYEASDNPAENELTAKVTAAVRSFEALLRPHLRLSGRRWGRGTI